MTDEDRKAVKRMVKDTEFDEAVKASASRLAAMGARPGDADPESWEGMMNMLADIERRGNAEDRAAAVLAAAIWAWGHKERCLYRKVADMLGGHAKKENVPAEKGAPAAQEKA